MRIALLGGVPPSLGGGGLEVQVERTAAALAGRGHDVFHVWQAREPRPFDLLHCFGADGDAWHVLHHWRRNPAPLVVSPVIVVAPGAAEQRQVAGARLPLPAFGPRLRRVVLQRADAVVALTEHERALVRRIAGRDAHVIGNGVDPLPAGGEAGVEPGYVLLLGAVSARKRQAEVVRALGACGIRCVVAGGAEEGEAAFAQVCADAGAQWLGEVPDRARVAALLRDAQALVHLSTAEGQALSVLEALSVGTPALLSPIPPHRELADRFPEHVRLVEGPGDLATALADLPPGPGPAAVPTWDAVAARLEDVYAALLR